MAKIGRQIAEQPSNPPTDLQQERTNTIPSLPTSNLTCRLTIFLICAMRGTAGAVVRTSQLATHESATSVDMSFHAFPQKLSEQIGFNVKGRIHAVVPKELASAFVTNDVMIKLGGEDQWRAVLQLWQNAERKTGEFVVG